MKLFPHLLIILFIQISSKFICDSINEWGTISLSHTKPLKSRINFPLTVCPSIMPDIFQMESPAIQDSTLLQGSVLWALWYLRYFSTQIFNVSESSDTVGNTCSVLGIPSEMSSDHSLASLPSPETSMLWSQAAFQTALVPWKASNASSQQWDTCLLLVEFQC